MQYKTYVYVQWSRTWYMYYNTLYKLKKEKKIATREKDQCTVPTWLDVNDHNDRNNIHDANMVRKRGSNSLRPWSWVGMPNMK